MIRALVVDDEYFVRKGLISTMPWSECGIRIVGEAANGAKALEWMEGEPVDLLITDLSMPVMNGFELMRAAKEKFPHVRVIVLTCHEDFKYVQDALRLGAIDYIVKTELEQDNMEDALRRIVGRLHELEAMRPQGETSGPDDQTEWSEEDERRLQKHMLQWLPLYWALRDEEFDRLRRELRDIRPSVSRLQKVAHYWLVEWSRTLDQPFLSEWLGRTETIGDWAAWEAFIVALRDRLRTHLQSVSHPEDVTLAILRAAEWVKTNMDARITQVYVARMLHMSRGYFSKCFREVIGKPFADYIKELRIARAKSLLLQTAKPIADIAEECGFLDHRYFSRQFREETGMLPSEYRNAQSVKGDNCR
jgi:two-component system response regulator YesN